MLYFLIWKALKSYRYLYIRYFISGGIIIRVEERLERQEGGGHCSAWARPPVAVGRHAPGNFLLSQVFLLSSICSQPWVSSFLFK